MTYNVGIAPTMSALQASHDLSRVAIKPGVYYITHVYNDTDVYKKINLRLCAERGVLVVRIYGLSVANWCSSRDGQIGYASVARRPAEITRICATNLQFAPDTFEMRIHTLQVQIENWSMALSAIVMV